ncbi:phospholipase [Aureococcus anophagefferens]|nr:phospholipase [Aureococcus anophagefferens]
MSFSDAEGEIAVVEFTILDAHDAAMALSLVRAALALTKHASAVVGVVAVHGERGGTALAYLEKSEAAELFARRWDGAALRSEPERAVATARSRRRRSPASSRVARGGLAPASVALAPWENGGDAPAWRLALHVALAVRSRLDGVAAAVDREDREAALHAFHERAHPAAGRRGWDAPTPAKFDREREKWSLDAAGPPPLAVDANGAGWQHCYAVAKVRLSRSDWLALHEARARHGAAAEDGEDLAALTDPAGNRRPSTPRPRPRASRSSTTRRRWSPRARRRRAAALGAARRRAADCRRLAAVAAASAADRARVDAARRSSLKAPWATALDDVFGPNGCLELNVALAPTRRMKGLDTWRAVRWLGAQHPRRVSLQPPVLFEYYAEALAWGDAGATKAVGRMLLDGGEGEPGRHALLYAPPRARGPASVFCALCRAMERSGDPSEIAASAAGRQKRAKFPTSKAPFSAVFHSFRLTFGRAIISRNGLEASAADYVACFDWVRSVCGRGAFAAALADRGDDAFGGAAVLHALCAATPSTANRRAIAALLRLGADPLAAAGPPAAFGSDADDDDDEAARGGPLFALGVAFSNATAARRSSRPSAAARRRGAAGDGGVLGAVVRDALRHAFTNTAMGLHLQLLLASPGSSGRRSTRSATSTSTPSRAAATRASTSTRP